MRLFILQVTAMAGGVGVSTESFHPAQLPKVHFTRLNGHYRSCLGLAELILKSTSFELGYGDVNANAFLFDMNVVFEKFVTTELRQALGLTESQFPENAKGRALYLDSAKRVSLKPGHHAAGPYRGFKTNAWDGGTRVPFLARWPEHIPPGATTDHLIGLTDVLATIAGVCGSPLPDGAGPDSVNQIAALLQKKDKMVARRSLVTYSYAGFFTLRQGKWKAIFGTKWSGGHPGNSYGGPAPKGMAADNQDIGQLYDISVDPFEQNDLWKKRPKVVRSLRRELERIKQLDKPDEIRWEQGESPNRLIKETK